MKKSLIFGAFFFSFSLNAIHLTPHPAVKKRPKYQTPYLSNVTDFRMLMKNNAMATLNPNQARYSMIEATLYKPAIIRVAQLFAEARYLRNIEGDPEKYGTKNLTQEQKKARAHFLSEDMGIVFRRNYRQVDRFHKRAKRHVKYFYEKIQEQMALQEHPQAQDFTREDALNYLKLIEDQGFFERPGPTYTKTFKRTGATQEQYYFLWSNITMKKLRNVIAQDGFKLLGDVKSLANANIKEEALQEEKEEADAS